MKPFKYIKKLKIISISFFYLFLLSCERSEAHLIDISHFNNLTIETMKTDGINPVLATRIFLYPNLAAYEIMAISNGNLASLQGKLTDFPKIEKKEDIYPELAAIHAYYKVMLVFNYREDLINQLYVKEVLAFKSATDKKIWNSSISYGNDVAQKVLAWANMDNYKQTKGKPYYLPDDKPGAWQPTPPDYRSALEPHWGTLRLLTFNNSSQFSSPFNIEFSTDTSSVFFKLAEEVYNHSINLSEEDKHIAEFWDDNPDLNNFKGHIPLPRRHINPTAHWMSIIGQIVKRENFDFEKSVQLYAMASIAFYDANLVCWYDKYTYNLVRPVTYIRNYIDPNWMPLLVTPPFPEHTSGHSACSGAAATVLEALLGEEYYFVDSTHFNVGFGVRAFSSLMDAAREVSMSRFYGGIHYTTGVKQGTEQGIAVGRHINKHFEH